MRSIEERLASADPAPARYEHPHFDAMLSRVVAASPARRDASWRAFRRRVVTAVAATGLLTGAGIAGLSTAGVSLPVLAFASAHASSAPQVFGASSTSAPMFMPIIRNWQFNAAALSDAPGTAPVDQVSAPSDPAATLARAASVLGVELGTASTIDNGTSFLAAGPLYSGSVVNFGGYASWSISVNNSAPVVSTSSAAATDAYDATAVAWTRELTSVDVGTPAATAIGLEGMGSGPVQVSVPLLSEGHATDFAFDFVFTADGTLVAANGVDMALSVKGDYPLLSPAAAVAQIPSQLNLHAFDGGWVAVGAAATGTTATGTGVAPPATSSTNESSAGTTAPSPAPGAAPDSVPSGGADVTTSVPTTVAPTVVELTGVTLRYSVYQMADGSFLLLPVYVYAGTLADGSTQDFRVMPIDPALVDLSIAVTPQIY